jgi:hypothetical protein
MFFLFLILLVPLIRLTNLVSAMLDWSDELNPAFRLNELGVPSGPCHLYVTSKYMAIA